MKATTKTDEQLAWSVQHAYEGSRWFRDHLERAKVKPESISGVADLHRLPFTTKEDLRDAYPLAWTAVPLADVVRVHASSGTTGKRIVASYTQRDVDDWAEMFARCYEYAGITRDDRVQITPGYGLWTAGIGFQLGAEKLGAMAVPTGPGNVDMQFELALDFETTVICATASFGLLLAEEAQRRGIQDRLRLRVGIFGSERWGDAMRHRIEALLGLESFDIYGMTELYGPGTGIDCERHDGIHYWDDYYVIEIVDPVSGEPLPPGEEGEIVVTTLRKEAMPLIRYRTRDLSRLYAEPCACGRPHPRIARLTGRTDDMVKVRGVALYPSQVDSVLSSVDGLGSEYQVVCLRQGGRDRLTIKVEAARLPLDRRLESRVAQAVKARIGVRPEVELLAPGTLPRSERKTRRVFDERAV
jgi:phenylacetate-CoA ligase